MTTMNPTMPSRREIESKPLAAFAQAVLEKVGTAGFEPATTRPPAECATRLRHVPTRVFAGQNHTRRAPCYHGFSVPRAAIYIRTDPAGTTPSHDEQVAACEAFALGNGH